MPDLTPGSTTPTGSLGFAGLLSGSRAVGLFSLKGGAAVPVLVPAVTFSFLRFLSPRGTVSREEWLHEGAHRPLASCSQVAVSVGRALTGVASVSVGFDVLFPVGGLVAVQGCPKVLSRGG